MKSLPLEPGGDFRLSHPARGAWIEIVSDDKKLLEAQSHPARGAWIEIFRIRIEIRKAQSHPARGAWIEIDSTPSEQ